MHRWHFPVPTHLDSPLTGREFGVRCRERAVLGVRHHGLRGEVDDRVEERRKYRQRARGHHRKELHDP